MRKHAALLTFLLASIIAWADNCSIEPITLYSDQYLRMRIFFDNNPARSSGVQLYSGDKIVRSVIADQNGSFRLESIPEGQYRIVIPHKGALDVIVLSRKSGLPGPEITWHLFPKSKFKWVAGKKVAERPCPTMVLKED